MGNNACKNPVVDTSEGPLTRSEKHFRAYKAVSEVQKISFPLSTSGAKIVDAYGKRIKLACVNWSGSHMCRHCVDGLQFRRLDDISREVREFGFNSIRLTFSLQLYYENPVIPDKYLTANPELKGKRAMEIFDLTITSLTRAGLMVILNNHTSSSMWCCSQTDGEGLWWTKEYPEWKWIDCLRHFAARYASNPQVIAFDIRNQIRKAPGFSPEWGTGDHLKDWRRAAIDGANEVLKINPNLLVMIGGLNYGLDLSGIKYYPLPELVVPNKLVLTGHFYGFSWLIVSWKLLSYERFKQKLYNEQTFVRSLGIPYFLGEFGTNESDIPWKYMIRYLKETDIDWSYWPLDGFKCDPSDDETYGIYNNKFNGVRHPWLLNDLRTIQKSLLPE